MSEYRVAIGVFAAVATKASLPWRSKAKQKQKTKRLGKKERRVKREEGCFQGGKRCVSLDRQNPWVGSKPIERRSQTLNDKERGGLPYSCRSRSPSNKRKTKRDKSVKSFTKYCIDCKTTVVDKGGQRGRRRERMRQECATTPCREHYSLDSSEVVLKTEDKISNFLTCTAAYECFLLEQAIFTVVQMLLLQAGIESNPGPTNPTECCNTSQHFNKVRNVIAEAQRSFKSKVAQDTLTKKVVDIQETGSFCIIISFLAVFSDKGVPPTPPLPIPP